jgi:hypothetical protein
VTTKAQGQSDQRGTWAQVGPGSHKEPSPGTVKSRLSSLEEAGCPVEEQMSIVSRHPTVTAA